MLKFRIIKAKRRKEDDTIEVQTGSKRTKQL